MTCLKSTGKSGGRGSQSSTISDHYYQVATPTRGWVKVNIDGSFKSEGRGGCGVVRGERGEWLKGFSNKLEESTQMATE